MNNIVIIMTTFGCHTMIQYDGVIDCSEFHRASQVSTCTARGMTYNDYCTLRPEGTIFLDKNCSGGNYIAGFTLDFRKIHCPLTNATWTGGAYNDDHSY
jgi:hypothetical protein